MIETSRTSSAYYDHLTPENSIILFIDLQTGLMPGIKTIDPIVLRNNIVALAKVTLLYDLPVILTTSGSKGPNGPIMTELKALFPDQPVIDRARIDAWEDPRILDIVENSGRRKLIMCGVSTDVSLAFAAISAVGSGYAAYAVLDASGTWNSLIEAGALARMAQAGVIPTNWAAVTAELQRDWMKVTGEEAARIFRDSLGPLGFSREGAQAGGPGPVESRR